MRYASVCDGIGAVHCAWQPLGWRCSWVSEIEPFPIAVVEHHWGIPNLGDMTRITEQQLEQHGPIELICGGTPCQSFSVAGLRKGLADPRGNLALEFLRLAHTTRARWLVWENVPGVLSSNGGRDFGAFVGALEQLGYGWAYRILDAQYFGVAQRRRRVFVVGCLGDWRRSAAVLFERDSLSGNPPPSRETGASVARAVARGSVGSGYRYDANGEDFVVSALTANGVGTCGADENQGQAGHLIAHSLRREGFDASEDGTGRGTPIVPVSYRTSGNSGVMEQGDRTACLNTATDPNQNIVRLGMAVRRLTPRECERLQGFHDDYTLVKFRGKPAADGPRYKAIGNSMAVPVMAWIGKRIQLVEQLAPSR